MNHSPDAVYTVFFISLTLLLVAGVVATFALKIHRAGHKEGKADGYAEGYKEGVTQERMRWYEAGAEMRTAMLNGDDFTQEEIDV